MDINRKQFVKYIGASIAGLFSVVIIQTPTANLDIKIKAKGKVNG